MDGRKNSGAIISDSDCFSLLGVTHAYENLVHAFGAKGSFHEVGNSDSSNERLLKQNERVFFKIAPSEKICRKCRTTKYGAVTLRRQRKSLVYVQVWPFHRGHRKHLVAEFREGRSKNKLIR